MRAAIWSLAIGVLAVALAALLSRVVPMPGALLVLLLAVCCGAVSLGAALIAEISVRVGAGGGAFAAALVAPVLGLTIAAAPLAPGAQRPGLADLLWLPLVGLLAALTLRGGAGWLGARAGMRLVRPQAYSRYAGSFGSAATSLTSCWTMKRAFVFFTILSTRSIEASVSARSVLKTGMRLNLRFASKW